MNKIKYLGVALAATLAACSTNDFDSAPAVNGNGMITAYTPQSGESTRTSYEADGSNLKVTWNTSNENMYTINAATDGWTAGQLKQVSASENGNAANFNAYDIAGSKQVGYKAGKLFAFYPQNTTVANSFNSLSAEGTTVSVPLSLTGQTGKLTDLHNYDYMTATSTVSADNKVGDLQMNHEIAMLHINKGIKTLVENGTISKVVISAKGMKTAGAMTITRDGSDITSTVAGTGSDADLTISNCSYAVKNNQLDDDIYLAILPGTMTDLKMKLTIDGNDFDYIYQGTVTDFQAGKVYNWSPTVDPGVMYFTIKTTASTKDFTIPFATSGTCPAQIVVNWGDGQSTTVSEGQSLTTTTFKHSYTSNNTAYRITVNSAQKDVTQKQIPEFNFSKYPSQTAGGSNGYVRNTNGEMLISMDSPVLNSEATDLYGMYYGTANLASVDGDLLKNYPNATNARNMFFCSATNSKPVNKVLKTVPATLFKYNTKLESFQQAFRNCKALESVPAGLFDKNTQVITFKATFYGCSSLKTVPAGLFDNNLSVTSFNSTFTSCSSLESLPSGLFAKNINVTDFQAVLAECTKLKLNEDLFIDATNTKATRFSHVSKMIDFMWAFENVGKDYMKNQQDMGKIIDLWNYTYTSYGCGVATKRNAIYNYRLASSGEYNDIPKYFSNWTSSGASSKSSTGWFIGTENKSTPTVLKKN